MKTFRCICVLLVLGGCSQQGYGPDYRPIIDTKGVNMAQYETDLRECQQYATQSRSAGEGAAGGAAAGAAVGGAVGAILGGGDAAAKGAGVGAVTGGVKGGSSAEQTQRGIIKKCLAGRGYRVLN